MKKLALATLAAIAALTATAQPNIPNGTLEAWTSQSGGVYFEPDGGFLSTLNDLYTIPPIAGGPGNITVERVTDAAEGTYAAKVTSKSFSQTVNIFVPGAIGTLKRNGVAVTLGVPFTGKPTKLLFSAKYLPVGQDSGRVFCLFSKYNAGQNRRDTVSYGALTFKSGFSTYQNLEIPFTYNNNLVPDTCTLLCVASAGYDFANIQNSAGELGSALFVDNLRFDYTSSVNNTQANTLGINLYPTPASNIINIIAQKPLINATLSITDLNGRLLLTQALQTNQPVNVATLPTGIYIATVNNNGTVVYTNRFVKQ